MDYFLTPQMKGEKPFNCYVCGKLLISDIEGEYTLKLVCPRCETKIVVQTKTALPDELVVKYGELVKL
jgi:DNA-directed RNA polymerase subunit RPC12/RpoP